MNKKSFQIKEVSDKGLVRAVIATLNVRDKDGDVTLSGAFGQQDVVVLPTHNWGHVPIGKGVVREEGNQAIAEIQMNMEIPAARDWFNALKFDLQKGQPLQEWSYGFTIKEGGAAEGEWEGQHVRFLKPGGDGEPGLKVHEVSPVLVGAGQDTGTLAVKESKEVAEGSEIGQSKIHKSEDGKRFCDEAEAALGAVMSLTERAKSLADLRAKEGRKMSEENRERLLKLSEALDAASVALKGILIPQCDTEALKELARFERFRAAKLRGDQ